MDKITKVSPQESKEIDHTNNALTLIENITGFALPEEVKRQIINDPRNQVKDWDIFNDPNNPTKLIYFLRLLANMVDADDDPKAVALARLFSALDHSTNLMHAWESYYAEKRKNGTTVTITQEVISVSGSVSIQMGSEAEKLKALPPAPKK